MKSYIHKDKSGKWRITLVARNGRIVCDGGEGYSTKQHAVAAARRLSRPTVARAFADPIVVDKWPLPVPAKKPVKKPVAVAAKTVA